MTVDEELSKLEDDIRRLKIEYEIYINGASPRLPYDTLSRVETIIKRYSSDHSKLSFGQRFRFTNIVQKYAVSSQLWRRKAQEKEEGRTIGGMPRRRVGMPAFELPVNHGPVRVVCSNPDSETDKVDQLLYAMKQARRRIGMPTDGLDAAVFRNFVREKTKQVKDTLGCEKVQFSISVEGGKVKFKATKAE